MNYVIAALVVIAGLFGFQNYMLKKENTVLHQNEGTYKAQIQELAGTIQQKDKDIEFCNNRTKQLKAESDKRAADAEKARKEAFIKGEENRQLADKLLTMKRTDENVCKQAMDLYNEYNKIRKDREAHGNMQ